MAKPLSELSYHIRKKIQIYDLEDKAFVLSISGGQDSMVLLHCFLELHTAWKPLRLKIFHVHHGTDSNENYRSSAQSLVVTAAQLNSIECVTNEKKAFGLHSEEGFRDLRKSEWDKLKSKGDILVTAHHRDDLFETRLHRLIRGTGVEGLIAMTEWNGETFRPLLEIRAKDILDYSQKHNISFVQDPTNLDTSYFRNWLRGVLLPGLEERQSGAVNAFAQSLENIARIWQTQSEFYNTWIDNEKIKRHAFIALDASRQMQLLAEMLRMKNINHYRRSQLDEVLKLLDRSQNDYTFEMLGCLWKVSSQWVEILVLD
jgi:tRNA(Ile)-lysidine synthase